MDKLKKTKDKYHTFMDDYGRIYYIRKEDLYQTKSTDNCSLDNVYVVLSKRYNTDIDQYADDDNSKFMIPEENSIVYLQAKEKKIFGIEKIQATIDFSYRYKWNRTGIVNLIFTHGFSIKRL